MWATLLRFRRLPGLKYLAAKLGHFENSNAHCQCFDAHVSSHTAINRGKDSQDCRYLIAPSTDALNCINCIHKFVSHDLLGHPGVDIVRTSKSVRHVGY